MKIKFLSPTENSLKYDLCKTDSILRLNMISVCDTGDVQLWNIPDEGLQQKLEEPSVSFKAHSEKASIIKFHPCAKDIIATASSDLTIRIWDISVQEEKYCLQGFNDQVEKYKCFPNSILIFNLFIK